MVSIFQRKRDLAYLLYFILHIPVMFCADLSPLYPDSIRPKFITDLSKWYITTYADQFFVTPPAWFTAYLWLELLFHVPMSLWAVGGLIRDDPMIPLNLLVYGLEVALTTLTCVADYLSWTTVTNAQKIELGKLYVPYLALSVFMTIDMYQRLRKQLSNKPTAGSKKTL